MLSLEFIYNLGSFPVTEDNELMIRSWITLFDLENNKIPAYEPSFLAKFPKVVSTVGTPKQGNEWSWKNKIRANMKICPSTVHLISGHCPIIIQNVLHWPALTKFIIAKLQNDPFCKMWKYPNIFDASMFAATRIDSHSFGISKLFPDLSQVPLYSLEQFIPCSPKVYNYFIANMELFPKAATERYAPESKITIDDETNWANVRLNPRISEEFINAHFAAFSTPPERMYTKKFMERHYAAFEDPTQYVEMDRDMAIAMKIPTTISSDEEFLTFAKKYPKLNINKFGTIIPGSLSSKVLSNIMHSSLNREIVSCIPDLSAHFLTAGYDVELMSKYHNTPMAVPGVNPYIVISRDDLPLEVKAQAWKMITKTSCGFDG